MIDHDPSDADPIGQIADEFVEAIRQGQRPSIEDFARRYPAHADEIREMLPALALMEQAKSGDASPGKRGPAGTGLLRQLGEIPTARTWAELPPAAQKLMRPMLEGLVRALLFVHEAPIDGPVSSSFSMRANRWRRALRRLPRRERVEPERMA